MDNILIVGANKQAISDLKSRLNERFEMSDLGLYSQYLGISVTRDRPNRTLYLRQEGYINQILTQHDIYNDPHSKGNGVAIPMEANTHLGPAPEGFTASKQSRHSYQSAVGSLMYAMMGTRPDIAYAVSVVSRYAANPHDSHWTAVKRIFRYLRGTVSLKLVFRGPLQPLSGYTDSDYIGDPDTRRSTSGYTFNLGSAAISWSSKRQPTVALSTCEAEYVGQCNATKEAIWLERLLAQLTKITPNPTVAPAHAEDVIDDYALITWPEPDTSDSFGAFAFTTVIFCDNQGTIALAKDPTNHFKTKHMHTKYCFLGEYIANKQVELAYCPTGDIIADKLTKPLPRDTFQRFRHSLGLE